MVERKGRKNCCGSRRAFTVGQRLAPKNLDFNTDQPLRVNVCLIKSIFPQCKAYLRRANMGSYDCIAIGVLQMKICGMKFGVAQNRWITGSLHLPGTYSVMRKFF